MLEDEEHDKIIQLLQDTWAHLEGAERNLNEVSHYITEDAEYKKLIFTMRLAKRRIEEAIFTTSFDLGDAR